MKLRNKKTGEIIELDNWFIYTDRPRGTYTSLADVNADWEDYTPKEPLIKDEKIRKAVRAWADVLGNKDIHVFHSEDMYNLFFRSEFSDLEIQFDGSFEEQIKDGTYTIEELCGEEE